MSNIPGWRTKRKLIVIESDDWGSIRMPSNSVFNQLSNSGVDLVSGDSKRYNSFDTIADRTDFEELYNVLLKFKDSTGRPPVITAMSVVANPDFERIRNDGFNNYYFEPITTTMEKYGYDNCIQSWRDGIERRLFTPQFHGREHLNVAVWMRALKNGDNHTMLSFEHEMWGFRNVNQFNISYQAAFDVEYPEDISIQKEVLTSGLNLFKDLFGYRATCFVPPNGPFNRELEKAAFDSGIKFIGTSKIHLEPMGQGVRKKGYHYLGEENSLGQRYITRNCFFEPNQPGTSWVESCVSDINNAFFWGKPAVLSSHRTNYIGVLDVRNREKGLKQLDELFSIVLRKWPEAEFVTTAELGSIIAGK